LGGSPPLRTPKFGRNNCLTYNFLHSEFQLSMLSSSKVLFWGVNIGGVLPPVRHPNLIKIIVSHTTSYIVSFNFLCQAIQNGPFFDPHFGGSPLTWSLIKTICKQPPYSRSTFSQTLRFLH